MAVYKETNYKHGANLPYKKIGCVTVSKGQTEVMIAECAAQGEKPLSCSILNIDKEIKDELCDMLLKQSYKFLKDKGLIQGEDC